MPKLEYRGIIARPGTYKRKDGTVIRKTWEELRRSFQMTQELMLTLGHPIGPDGRPRPANVRDFLARVLPIIDDERQVIDSIIKFHDEPWDGIPEHIRDKIVNDWPVEISAGYTSRTEADGLQTGMLHHHIALLVDSESPICPLGQCGINVTLECDKGDIEMQYEQAESTKDKEEGPTSEEEPAKAPEPKVIHFTEEQFKTLIDTLRPQPEPEAGAETTEEEAGKEPVEKSLPDEEGEPETAPHREPSLEPERAFPAGKPGKTKLPYLKDDGSVEIPSELFLGGKEPKT